MLKLLPLLLALLLLPAGRRIARGLLRSGRAVWRPGAGLFAVLALAAAAVLALRDDPWGAGVLACMAAGLALAARWRKSPARSRSPPRSGMARAEASALLGLPADAPPAAVEAAYRRLMRLAHPDRGGTDGLASQLNLARNVLRGRP